MKVVVLKFGGSSLGNRETILENLKHIGAIIKKHKKDGYQLVLAISALSGKTRELKALGHSLSLKENTSELDSLLAVGEEESSSLVAGYLKEVEGLSTKILMRDLLPIKTNGDFGRASVEKVVTDDILEALKKDEVVVIPGFIGSFNGMTTTLGLDGSDTTAVALSGALKAERCKFYKDVFGIYTSNPRRVKLAKRLEKLSFKEMSVMSQLGARVFHPNSIAMAQKYNMVLEVSPFFTLGGGSLIQDKGEELDVVGVTFYETEDSYIVSVIGNKISHDREIERVIAKLSDEYILAKEHKTEFGNMSVSIRIKWQEQLNSALQTLHSFYGLDGKEEDTNAFYGEGKHIFDPSIIRGTQ